MAAATLNRYELTAMTQESAGGVVLTCDGGEAFVALVRKRHGTWVLPKGHVEPDETLHETALREVAEETGLDKSLLEVTKYLGSWNFNEHDPTQAMEKRNHFFLMKFVPGGRPSLSSDADHAGADWCRLPLCDTAFEYAYQGRLIRELQRINERELRGMRGGGPQG